MTRIFRNPDILWREEDEALSEACLGLESGRDVEEIGTSLLFAGGEMVALNLLGTEIWKICDGRTPEEIVAMLLDEFEVEPDILRADVDAFLAELAAKGFIRHEE
jgi:GeoRSP system PqqD family protein